MTQENFENMLEQQMVNTQHEKTFIDKVLARQEVNELRRLVRQKSLNRQDMSEILNILVGVEAKLYNLNDYDRYVLLKYFAWVRNSALINELLSDYIDDVKKINLSARSQKLLNNIQRLMAHNVIFLVDVYLNIARTSLSVGASAFKESLGNRFEVSYGDKQKIDIKEPQGVRMYG